MCGQLQRPLGLAFFLKRVKRLRCEKNSGPGGGRRREETRFTVARRESGSDFCRPARSCIVTAAAPLGLALNMASHGPVSNTVPLEPLENLFVAPTAFALTMGVYHGWTLRQLASAAHKGVRHNSGRPPPIEYLLWLCHDETRWKRPTPELVNIHRSLRQLERDGFFVVKDYGMYTLLRANEVARTAYADLGIEALLDNAQLHTRHLCQWGLPAPIAARIARLAVVVPAGLNISPSR